jgi:short-subunit dehydrogenase
MAGLDSFGGCTAVITGASRGIGAEFARQLAGAGAGTLVLTARSDALLLALARDLETAHGVTVEVVPLDLSKPGAAAQLHECCRLRGIQVDLLVNNAGFGKWGRFEERELEELQCMVALNVTALLELTWRFGSEMLARRQGGVIQVGSLSASFAIPFVGVYAASKAFVQSLSEALWAEWQDRGVMVTCLSPGPVDTEFHQTSESYLPGRRMQSVAAVVAQGLRGFLAGRPVVYPSALDALQARVGGLARRQATALLRRKLEPPPAD